MDQQKVIQELTKALEDQDEAQVGRILTGVLINSRQQQKSGDTNFSTLMEQIGQVFENLSGSHQSYWQNIAQSYTS
jgi:hypothetical protein